MLVSLKESDAVIMTLNTSKQGTDGVPCKKQEVGILVDLGLLSVFPSYSLCEMDNVWSLSDPQYPLL